MLNFTGLDCLIDTDISEQGKDMQKQAFWNWVDGLDHEPEYSPTAHKDIVALIYICPNDQLRD